MYQAPAAPASVFPGVRLFFTSPGPLDYVNSSKRIPKPTPPCRTWPAPTRLRNLPAARSREEGVERRGTSQAPPPLVRFPPPPAPSQAPPPAVPRLPRRAKARRDLFPKPEVDSALRTAPPNRSVTKRVQACRQEARPSTWRAKPAPSGSGRGPRSAPVSGPRGPAAWASFRRAPSPLGRGALGRGGRIHPLPPPAP